MCTVVIGAAGQLGSDIMRLWPAGDTIGLAHADIEVTDREQVLAVLRSHKPDLVVDTAAFHNVDACESEPERTFPSSPVSSSPERLPLAARPVLDRNQQ
jgi:dTDP-4-dehydrorhamnose reductase